MPQQPSKGVCAENRGLSFRSFKTNLLSKSLHSFFLSLSEKMNLGKRLLQRVISNYNYGLTHSFLQHKNYGMFVRNYGSGYYITKLERFVREECKSGKIQKLEDGWKYFDQLILERALPSNEQVKYGFCLLGEMLKRGYQPDVITFTTLIKGLCLQEKIDFAVIMFDRMTQTGIQPDAYTCNIWALRLVDQALVLFSEMLRDSNVVPTVIAYNSLVNGLCSSGRLNEAKRVFDEMHGQWEEARRYFDAMLDRGVSPDTITFNILIDSHCKDGMTEDAWGLFKLMDKLNIKPDRITYDSMIDGLCLTGRLPEALQYINEWVLQGMQVGPVQLFNKMKQNGLEPTIVTYNTLLRGLYGDGRVRTANNLVNKMKTFGISPDEVTYSTMLDGLCKNRKIGEAIELFESMEGRGISANIGMYSILICGYCKAGKLEDARKLFNEISSKGLAPDVVTYTTMIDGFLRRKMLSAANKLIIEMEEKGCLPDARTYDTIIKGFFIAKETDKALHYLVKMREKEFVPCDSVVSLLTNELKNL
ncbi:pentatricopeptide repeat-containing protein At1g63130, mitochondrial-like [Papaver somniferum]|nr:pentatricopeptide repeat-containing protein At1g63130, mitochondrial-like [Papaver somniferum]